MTLTFKILASLSMTSGGCHRKIVKWPHKPDLAHSFDRPMLTLIVPTPTPPNGVEIHTDPCNGEGSWINTVSRSRGLWVIRPQSKNRLWNQGRKKQRRPNPKSPITLCLCMSNKVKFDQGLFAFSLSIPYCAALVGSIIPRSPDCRLWVETSDHTAPMQNAFINDAPLGWIID